MAHKNTVAIIGAAGTTGTFIAKGISNGPYRLLLMDDATAALTALQSDISKLNSNAETDAVKCCKDASWEADIIVVAVANDQQEAAALKMKEVATCKTVISITPSAIGATSLQSLLPHSKVVLVTRAAENSTAIIEGNHAEAIDTAVEMIKMIGLHFSIKGTGE
jgi:ketopantoate reductase